LSWNARIHSYSSSRRGPPSAILRFYLEEI
jgi:hypothetical protein